MDFGVANAVSTGHLHSVTGFTQSSDYPTTAGAFDPTFLPDLVHVKGTLDGNGLASAAAIVPANLGLPLGITFHHAYVVYDANGMFYMASNAVPLVLK